MLLLICILSKFEFTFRKDHMAQIHYKWSILDCLLLDVCGRYRQGIIGIIGMLLCQFLHGTWICESGILDTSLRKVGVGM